MLWYLFAVPLIKPFVYDFLVLTDGIMPILKCDTLIRWQYFCLHQVCPADSATINIWVRLPLSFVDSFVTICRIILILELNTLSDNFRVNTKKHNLNRTASNHVHIINWILMMLYGIWYVNQHYSCKYCIGQHWSGKDCMSPGVSWRHTGLTWPILIYPQ